MGVGSGTCKNQREKVRVRVAGSENMNVHVHKNRVTSQRSGQRRDVAIQHCDVTERVTQLLIKTFLS